MRPQAGTRIKLSRISQLYLYYFVEAADSVLDVERPRLRLNLLLLLALQAHLEARAY